MLTLSAVGDSRSYNATTGSAGAPVVSGLFSGDTISGLSQSFDSKNAGSRTLSVNGGYAISDGNGGGNYAVSLNTAAGTITPAALAISAVGDSRSYNATTGSAGAPIVSGLFTGDTISGLGQSFDSKNAGARTLSVNGGYTISDGNGGGNYTVTLNGAAGTITPATLTLSAVGDSRSYNATTGSAGAPLISGLFSGDTIGGLSQSFDSKNVGTRTLLVNGGYAVSDGNGGGNYTVTLNSAAGTITPAALTLSAVGDSRSYNATTGSAGAPTVSGLFTGDTISGLSQSFDSKNAGSRILTVNGGYAVSDGNGGGNYTVTLNSAAGTITPATLTLSAVGDSRSYNATTGSAGAPIVSGLFTGDTISGLSQSFDSKNAGARTLMVNGGYAVSDGNGGGNYTVSLNTAAGSITPATLTIGGLTANDKVYDSTTAASFAGAANLFGVFAGDSVGVSGTASGNFANKNVGSNKPVTLNTASLSLTGVDAGNYQIAAPNAFSASITPATLLVTGLSANDKVYDATTSATLSGSALLTGVYAGDTVSLVSASPTASFVDKNVGTKKQVAVSGLGALSGADAGNYVLVPSTALVASITPAPLTIEAISQNKQQGNAFSFTGSEIAATGLKGGEQITSAALSSTGASADAAFGNYPILVSQLVGAGGFAAANYQVNYKPGVLVVSGIATQASQQVNNQVVTFLSLFTQEFVRQNQNPADDDKGKSDIVVTDTSCKPG
jgi:hypothetical protein